MFSRSLSKNTVGLMSDTKIFLKKTPLFTHFAFDFWWRPAPIQTTTTESIFKMQNEFRKHDDLTTNGSPNHLAFVDRKASYSMM